MSFIPTFSFELNNTWIFSLIYLIISNGFIFLIPKHNISKFTQVPKIKYINTANYILYYSFFIISMFVPIKNTSFIFILAISIFIIGILLYTTSIFYFAISEYDKPVTEKLYQMSRHPVYLSFLIIGVSISLAGVSFLLLIIIILHFISTYYIAKEEEKQCIEKYGKKYKDYMKKVRMFI